MQRFPNTVRVSWLGALALLVTFSAPVFADKQSAPPPDESGGAPADGLSKGLSDKDGDEKEDRPLTDEDLLRQALNDIIEIDGTPAPGSEHAIDAEELERFERDDIHKVLATVPGVYIRQEDGFGLRPNIGMRGSGSERSAKIALLEDGVLSAPAPYSAPAAYYFPLVTRMTRIEVLKGPSAVRYGPNTVGGTLNLISKPIPEKREVILDVAGGSTLYGKTHGSYGERWKHGGFLLEAAKIRSDGFKVLDGGGNTGFDKNDALLKLVLNSRRSAPVYHELNGKFGYSNEVSNETYTGVADKDFDVTPYRRYAGTQLDRMNWDHQQLQLSYRADFAEALTSVTATIYQNTFSRDWRKLNGFNTNRTLSDILASPDEGANAVFYSVLTGQTDSLSSEETLLLGTNARDFVSKGLQLAVQNEREGLWGIIHNIDAGVRFHRDQARRYEFEEGYRMRNGVLDRESSPMKVNTNSTGYATAFSFHAQQKSRINKLEVTAGARTELINTEYVDHDDGSRNDGTQLVLIPGAGATYQLHESLAVLAGVHKGFVPAAPNAAGGQASPEKSVNYEAGFRSSALGINSELVGFFSNYSNLKGTCSFSAGCMQSQVGNEFNGGRVHVMGLEATAGGERKLGPLRLPVKLTYTFNHSEFQTSFVSGNAQWGSVEKGDELPYLPAHQLAANVGLGGERWETALAARYTSAMRDFASQGMLAPQDRTESATVLDFAGNVQLWKHAKLYTTVNNIFDQANIVSRRPFGARPGAPRMVIMGIKGTM
jgi:Fe(3+) dicitrate transport protein